MQAFSTESQAQELEFSNSAKSEMATSGSPEREHPVLRLQRSIGNQAVLRMLRTQDGGSGEAMGAGSGSAPSRAEPEGMKNCKKNYLVESWESDTCCVNRGFPDPETKNKKSGAACCNKFPEFVDNQAAKLGFDGAASCREPGYLNHRARVTPGGSSTSVEVLCVDTRKHKKDRVIELGFNAAQKAYGSNQVHDPKATVCIGDKAEAETCFFDKACKPHPKEDECLPADCSKSPASSEEHDPPKK